MALKYKAVPAVQSTEHERWQDLVSHYSVDMFVTIVEAVSDITTTSAVNTNFTTDKEGRDIPCKAGDLIVSVSVPSVSDVLLTFGNNVITADGQLSIRTQSVNGTSVTIPADTLMYIIWIKNTIPQLRV